MEKAPSTFTAWALRDALQRLRAALAAAERERDEARDDANRLCTNWRAADAELERILGVREHELMADGAATGCFVSEPIVDAAQRVVAERDAARAEVERARATLKAADTLCDAVEWTMENFSVADLTTTPVKMMIGVERDLNRTAGAYRQLRAERGEAGA